MHWSMRTTYCLIALLTVLLVACATTSNPSVSPRATTVTDMTTNDLDRLVARQDRSFEEVKRLLQLEHSDYHIMEGGSIESLTYRFSLGKRFLFLEVDQSSHLVTRAFFVE